jgi:hypothetical protein
MEASDIYSSLMMHIRHKPLELPQMFILFIYWAPFVKVMVKYQSGFLEYINMKCLYSVYIKSENTLNYLLHKNYKLYRHHIRVILKRNSEIVYVPPMRVILSFTDSQR